MATYVSGAITVPGPAAISNDTELRAWVNQTRAALSGVGLVQTSDTGQIDPVTVTYPSGAVDIGYEIWRFSDAAQATDPVFIKLWYRKSGTSTANYYSYRFQIGQGSNGSGALTGTVSNSTYTLSYDNTGTTSGTAQTLAFFGDGTFWLADGAGFTSTGYGEGPRNCVVISRTRDADGNLDGRGVVRLILSRGSLTENHYLQFVRWASGIEQVYPETRYFCFRPGSPVAAYDVDSGGVDRLAYPVMYYDPGYGVRTLPHVFGFSSSVSPPVSPTAFDADPHGTGSRRWISWLKSPTAGPRAYTYADYSVRMALPWEED
jgi:hypothetical protein